MFIDYHSGLLNYYSVPITITITSYIETAYYYYYYVKYLNSLLLLLLLDKLGKPITITFPDYYYYYYFPSTIAFIITVEPQKHNTSRLQSNIPKTFITSIGSHTTKDTLSQIISL